MNTIFQLRLHPSIIKLKEAIDKSPKDKIFDLDLTYITSRGNWYFISWKGDIQRSGGIATNIGVHFFDMLTWIFGNVKKNVVHISKNNKAAGFLELEKARVRWFLSVDKNDIPVKMKENGQRTFRSIKLEGKEIDFSDGFADLHTISYQKILLGQGFGLENAKKSIETVYTIRNTEPIGLKGNYHPICKKIS